MARPTKYKNEYCARLLEHMSKGYSYETFAAILEVSRQTLYDWEIRHPEFLDTKRKAQDKCQLWWEKQCIEGLYDQFEQNEKGQSVLVRSKANPSLVIFNMKSRFRWRDNHEVLPEPKEIHDLDMNQKKLMLAKAQTAIEILKKEIESEEKEV